VKGGKFRLKLFICDIKYIFLQVFSNIHTPDDNFNHLGNASRLVTCLEAKPGSLFDNGKIWLSVIPTRNVRSCLLIFCFIVLPAGPKNLKTRKMTQRVQVV
jgi:hypothetical protein